jgi:hypothetical protein
VKEVCLAANGQGFQILPTDFENTFGQIAARQCISGAEKRANRARDETGAATEIEHSERTHSQEMLLGKLSPKGLLRGEPALLTLIVAGVLEIMIQLIRPKDELRSELFAQFRI